MAIALFGGGFGESRDCNCRFTMSNINKGNQSGLIAFLEILKTIILIHVGENNRSAFVNEKGIDIGDIASVVQRNLLLFTHIRGNDNGSFGASAKI